MKNTIQSIGSISTGKKLIAFLTKDSTVSSMKMVAFFSLFFLSPHIADAQVNNDIATGMAEANTKVWTWAQTVVQYGMFAYLLLLIYQALFSGDKQGAWWKIISVIVFIILIEFAPQIYQGLTGHMPTT